MSIIIDSFGASVLSKARDLLVSCNNYITTVNEMSKRLLRIQDINNIEVWYSKPLDDLRRKYQESLASHQRLERLIMSPDPSDMGPVWERMRVAPDDMMQAIWKKEYEKYCATIMKEHMTLRSEVDSLFAQIAEALRRCEIEQNKCVSICQSVIASYNLKVTQWKRLGPTFFLNDYGRIDETVLSQADQLCTQGITVSYATMSVLETLSAWTRSVNSGVIRDVVQIKPELLPIMALSLARTKPIHAIGISNCANLYYRLAMPNNPDFKIIDLYAKKVVGGDDAVVKEVNELVRRTTIPPVYAEYIASGLMWMESYRSERVVLEYMLSHNMHMSAKAQERLHFLSTGRRTLTARPIDIDEKKNQFYFETSSISWDQKQLLSFFDNLSFQERSLEYALAVRDLDKTLAIPRGFKIPEKNRLLQPIIEFFEEEYDDDASVELANCSILADGVLENIDSYILKTSIVSELSVSAIMEKIGRRLTIKFYTLYIPSGNIDTDRKGTLSLMRKSNPKVTMWEEGLIDTFLSSIERVLNNGSVSTSHIDISHSSQLVF